MARAIVRYSFDQNGVGSRQAIRNGLEAAGFQRIGTASFEADVDDLRTLTRALRAALDVAAHPIDGRLDHLWIYIDRGVED